MPPAGRQRSQGGQPVSDPHDGHVTERRRIRDGSRHDERRRAMGQGLGDKGVAVDAFPGKRHEGLTRLDQPRIDRGPADRPW